jgi:hypothetical protein
MSDCSVVRQSWRQTLRLRSKKVGEEEEELGGAREEEEGEEEDRREDGTECFKS